MPTLDDLRRYAIARSLFQPTTLKRALDRLAFVQADPIRAPARAQDLILRHRVKSYRSGDLERLYPALGIEEDFFIVYGFVTQSLSALMHPRSKNGAPTENLRPWSPTRLKQAQLLLDFVAERGAAHPRDVDAHFAHGKVTNYWGGSSNATTHLLSAMHYRGMLRIVRRDAGIRVYAPHQHGPEPLDPSQRQSRLDALVDILVQIYAPLPAKSLAHLVRRLRYAAPQWHKDLTATLNRAKNRLANATITGVDWYWPADEEPSSFAPDTAVRLLAPFDPIVWDRDRFELFWNWPYRFEAYTPAPKRRLGYYALPMLFQDRVIGWANLSIKTGSLTSTFGYVHSPPKNRAFPRELEAELHRIQTFLNL